MKDKNTCSNYLLHSVYFHLVRINSAKCTIRATTAKSNFYLLFPYFRCYTLFVSCPFSFAFKLHTSFYFLSPTIRPHNKESAIDCSLPVHPIFFTEPNPAVPFENPVSYDYFELGRRWRTFLFSSDKLKCNQ